MPRRPGGCPVALGAALCLRRNVGNAAGRDEQAADEHNLGCRRHRLAHRPALPSKLLLAQGKIINPTTSVPICIGKNYACIRSTGSALGWQGANYNTDPRTHCLDGDRLHACDLLRWTSAPQPVKSSPSLNLEETSVAGGKTQSLSKKSRPSHGATTAISNSCNCSGASAL